MRFPGAVLHAEDVSFTHAKAAKPVVRNVNITIEKGDRVALVGPNGHGKVRRRSTQTPPGADARVRRRLCA
jgi:energy-coupling factor transporter ATP-binding protein EcfA2